MKHKHKHHEVKPHPHGEGHGYHVHHSLTGHLVGHFADEESAHKFVHQIEGSQPENEAAEEPKP